MSLTARSPAPGESLACDLCNVTREYGRYDTVTGKVICVVCCKIREVAPKDGIPDPGGYTLPADAIGSPDSTALTDLFA